jgi:hypothetical protein
MELLKLEYLAKIARRLALPYASPRYARDASIDSPERLRLDDICLINSNHFTESLAS